MKTKTERVTLALLVTLTVGALLLAQQDKAAPRASTAPDPLPIERTGELLFVVRVNGKKGFIDTSGSVVIKPTFQNAYEFSEGLAAVQVEGRWGYIDVDGRMVIEPRFAMSDSFSEGLASFRDEFHSPFGYINKQGVVVIPQQFDSCRRFRGGVARVGFQTLMSKFVCKFADVSKDCRYRHIDRTGSYVAESSRASVARKTGELKAVSINNFRGYADSDGNLVIAPQFKFANAFSEGLAGVRIGERDWGFINTSGEVVIEPRFSWVYGSFRHGLVKVVVDQKAGYIDKQGAWVWKPSG